ncbi:zinc finger protein 845-like [Diabrotica virgifera virgifera]|uniref:C2H2-type domain-containing protein n=2 Tax=Diabrotica virgifera virgifera TaxID=50390 RepID=A0ABM5IAS2_DIAVI|nr:zinc finger protein 845-like [Diabrotica virgifera virgifera]
MRICSSHLKTCFCFMKFQHVATTVRLSFTFTLEITQFCGNNYSINSYPSTLDNIDLELAIGMFPECVLIVSEPNTTNDETVFDRKIEKIKDPLENTKKGKRKTNEEKSEAKKSKPKEIPVYYRKRVPIVEYKNPFDYFAFENNLLTASAMKKRSLREEEIQNTTTDDIQFECRICYKKHGSKDSLFNHYEMHKAISDLLDDATEDQVESMEEGKITCDLCQVSFKDKWNYNHHVLRTHKSKEHYCDICKRNYDNEYRLSIHNATHSSDPHTFVCVVCKTFSTPNKESLYAHIRSEHLSALDTNVIFRANGQSIKKYHYFELFYGNNDIITYPSTLDNMDLELDIGIFPECLLVVSEPNTTNEMIFDKKQEEITDPLKDTKKGKRKTNRGKSEAKKSKSKEIPVNAYAMKQRSLTKKEMKNTTNDFLWECKICCKEYRSNDSLCDHYEMHKTMLDQLDDSTEDQIESMKEEKKIPHARKKLSSNVTTPMKIPVSAKEYKNPFDYCAERCKTTWKCKFCFENLESKSTLLEHYEMHKKVIDKLEDETPKVNEDKKSVKCDLCLTEYKDKWRYERHLLNFHGIQEDLYCALCKIRFASKASFHNHRMIHAKQTGPIGCDMCSLQFSTERRLFEHKQEVHVQLTRYKCFKCDLTLPFKTNLDEHNRRIHTSTENSYLCNICGRGYPRLGPLTHHMKIHNEGQYVCSVCGKKFKQKQNLKIHSRVHTGEKPFKCHICDKSFSQKPPLNVHLRIHSGERRFACKICKKGFVTKTIRDYHEKNCSNIKKKI